MDNFQLDITSEGREEFDLALGLAINHAPGHKAEAYAVHPEIGLVFFWSHDSKTPQELQNHPTEGIDYGNKEAWAEALLRQSKVPIQKLLFKMTAASIADFAWAWLREQDYGSEPDHDGSNGKGWRIYNESWGHVGRNSYAFVAIQPQWAMYGK